MRNIYLIFLVFLLFVIELKSNNILEYEYWIDNNFANRISTSVSPPVQSLIIDDSLNISSCNVGLHLLSFRFKDSVGLWSCIKSNFFLVPLPVSEITGNKITGYEYWVDTDYTSKISNNITPTSSFVFIDSLNFQALDKGLHILQFRFRDAAGRWSCVNKSFFLVSSQYSTIPENKIVAYEYWVDGDFPNRSINSISPVSSFVLFDSLNFSSINKGLHIISIRFKDATGKWSGSKSSFFLIPSNNNILPDNKVSSYRYWIDDNINDMMTVTFDVPVNPLDLIKQIPLPIYDHGSTHFFKVQFRDIAGLWGSVMIDSFRYISRATLIYPTDSSHCVELNPVFKWQKYADQSIYHIQVSDSPQFANLLIDVDNIADTTYQPLTNITASRMLYWRVQEHYGDYTSNWSDTWMFSTTGDATTYMISGVLKYNNTVGSPLKNVFIVLKDLAGNFVSITKTDFEGNFEFQCQSNGQYKIRPIQPDIPWGGLSTVDIVKTRQKIAFLITFTQLQNKAADVNLTNSVTATDVVLMRQKIAFMNPQQWIIPNYVFEDPTITVNEANVNVTIYCLCAGDVNGSYVPTY